MNTLEIKNISYQTKQQKILNNISLRVLAGECISIVGESGSGKSTLLRLCADLISPTTGTILFNGLDYNCILPTSLRKDISYCIQIPKLFGKTIQENLEYPYILRNMSPNKERIYELLDIFDLPHNIINKGIHELSGGQKQRVALVRNLIFTPKILLLDEVTSSLDKENELLVEKYILSLVTQGVTVLWVTHNDDQSKRIFSKRILMHNGKISNVEVL